MSELIRHIILGQTAPNHSVYAVLVKEGRRKRDYQTAAQCSPVCAVENLAAKLSVASRLYYRKSLPCQQHHFSTETQTGRQAGRHRQTKHSQRNKLHQKLSRHNLTRHLKK